MNATQLQKTAKVIRNGDEKPVEVIISFEVFQEMVELAMCIEIYQQEDTQRSLTTAKEEIAERRTPSFTNASESSAWLQAK